MWRMSWSEGLRRIRTGIWACALSEVSGKRWSWEEFGELAGLNDGRCVCSGHAYIAREQ